MIELGGEAVGPGVVEGELGQGAAGTFAPVHDDPLRAALRPLAALAVVEAAPGREQAGVEAQDDRVAEVLVAADDDLGPRAVLGHVEQRGPVPAAAELQEARAVHAVSGEEDGEAGERDGPAPAAGAQGGGGDAREQDQAERDPDQEVAEVDHLGARRGEDRGRRQRDRDRVEEPRVVALAREAQEPECEQREPERRVGAAELEAHGEAQRVADGARRDLGGHGGRPAADAQVAQVDEVEEQQDERRGGVQPEGVREPDGGGAGAAREAQRRPGERSAPEEDEDELREDAEAGRDREERGGPRPAALEEAQEREERGERQADGERVAARLRRVEDQREAPCGERGREQRLEPPAPARDRRGERDRRRAREQRGQPVERPRALVAEPVEEQRVQVVVVRVVELREDAEGRVELPGALPGPDLVEPEVVGAGDRAQHRPGRDAGRDGEPGPAGARAATVHGRRPQISTRGALPAVR